MHFTMHDTFTNINKKYLDKPTYFDRVVLSFVYGFAIYTIIHQSGIHAKGRLFEVLALYILYGKMR